MPEDTFDNKTVVITGASAGLGRRLALDLARQKARLVLAARDEPALRTVESEVAERGGQVRIQPTDVTDSEQCRNLIDRAVSEYGRIDYVILNAGVSMWCRFEEVTDVEVFGRLMNVNYLGAVHCLHAALPHLRRSAGTVVAISSLQSFFGLPYHTGYAASKHALQGFLESFEMELGTEIRVLNVRPGWIRGTRLRANAYSADGSEVGESKRRHSSQSVSVEECSAAIVKAMKDGSREIFIPNKMKHLPLLKVLFPKEFRRRLLRAVERQKEQRDKQQPSSGRP